MNSYKLTRRATVDLDGIWDHIAERNPDRASRFIDKICRKLRLLARHPLLGSDCSNLAPDLRFFVVGKYVIYHRPLNDGIEVLRVVHGARDIDSIFG